VNRYEAMVILPESLTEEEIEAGLSLLSDVIKKRGGTLQGKPTRLGRKPFARPMKKQQIGEYALLRMELDGAEVSNVHEDVRLEDAIFRLQISRLPEPAKAS